MDTSPETGPDGSPEPGQTARPLGLGGRRRGVAGVGSAIRRQGVTPQPTTPDEDPLDTEAIPEQLADMRWVYAHPAREDCTQGHKVCRKWMDADLPGFMARKSGMEAKLPASGGKDEEFPVRVQLDRRRLDPTCNHDEMVSLLIGWGADKAVELYLTLDEWCSFRDSARDAGLPLGDWMLRVCRTGAVATLAGPGMGGSGAGSASCDEQPVGEENPNGVVG
jgi:hypothetical protein